MRRKTGSYSSGVNCTLVAEEEKQTSECLGLVVRWTSVFCT